ncbi:reverse transcriptase domain-containing protein [Tanacetum coccineum]
MTGVLRHIAEHQRVGGMTSGQTKKERPSSRQNQAIQEEVEKLIDADFKDLNKACPKDSYPLPKIDWKVESLCGFLFKCFLDAYRDAFRPKECWGNLPAFGGQSIHKQIGRNLEVYVDDLVIKSRTEDKIIKDIEETFKTVREINMKLNPKKCTFGVEEGMFLGYKVNTKGIKVCPNKAYAVLSLPSLKCLKDVQKLNGKLASLNRFLTKSAEKSLPFFKTLKKCTKKSDFHWIEEVESAFKQMKQLIAKLLMLTAPKEKKEIIVYLAAAKEGVSAFLMTEREAKQMPVYFVSHALRDFIVERPEEDFMDTPMEIEVELPEPWILFTDGSSCADGSGAGLILTNPEGAEFTYAIRFMFEATNNEVEYEALITGLRIAEQMSVKNLQANVDSRLVANQVNETYIAKEADMIKYIQKADALSKITSTSFAHLSKQVLVGEVNKRGGSVSRGRRGRGYIDDPDLRVPYGRNSSNRGEQGKSGATQVTAIRRTRSVVAKALRIGYYWPTMHKDARTLIRACQDCQRFAFVKHPQENGLVERANRSLGEGSKARLDARSKDWVEEITHAMWAHRTMIKSRNRDTIFSLKYGTEAVIPAEIGMPTLRTTEVDMVQNNVALEINLDLLEERREHAAIREAKSKAKIEKYYNSKVHGTIFKP